ncbi:MAG: hypothetical protein V4489_02600, partial [Chlamydiota bacterium]
GETSKGLLNETDYFVAPHDPTQKCIKNFQEELSKEINVQACETRKAAIESGKNLFNGIALTATIAGSILYFSSKKV